MKMLADRGVKPRIPPQHDEVTFDEGVLEKNLKQKMLFNKEKQLRNKFAKEHETTKKETLEDLYKKNLKNTMRVKVLNVNFIQRDEPERVEQQKDYIRDVI